MTEPPSQVYVYPSPHSALLGRHVDHDARSRNYDVRSLLAHPKIPAVPIYWDRPSDVIFDQNACSPKILTELGADPTETGIGCCTMAAAYGLLLTEPNGAPGRHFTMADVLRGYVAETRLDERRIKGMWPPTDTGSTALYSMRVLRKQRLIQAYQWAFSLRDALAYLAYGPLGVGSPFYASFFEPVVRDGHHILEIDRSEDIAGGHQYVIDAIHPQLRMVRMTNSWGRHWGDNGQAWMAFSTFDRLLSERGDVVVPVLRPRLR